MSMNQLGTGRTPATIVTGFLGSGKTSLLRHLMTQTHDRRFAVIVNEFGDLGVDGDLLRNCGACADDDIVELANGCICCTVADDFLPTMQRLLDRNCELDHILIETSGLALPKPLVRAFTWPTIRNRVTVDGVIAVVDAAATAAGLFAPDPQSVTAARLADPSLDHETPLEELFEEQLQCADMVILNKMDVTDGDQRAAAERAIGPHLRPGVRMIAASHGRVDPRLLLGMGASAEADLDSRRSHHDDGGEHDHDDFESFIVPLNPVVDAEWLADRIRDISREHDVLRVKGFVEHQGKAMRLAVQAVGERVTHYFDRPWERGESRNGALVIIGLRGLDRPTIEHLLKGTAAA